MGESRSCSHNLNSAATYLAPRGWTENQIVGAFAAFPEWREMPRLRAAATVSIEKLAVPLANHT